MSITGILLLYILFRLKHFLCDFVLQSNWMALNKGKPGRQGLYPLFAHAGVHGLGTLIVTLLMMPFFWWLAICDVFIHAAIDRIKAVMSEEAKLSPRQHKYWVMYGLDQEAHNFTHLCFIVLIVLSTGPVQF